MAAETSVGSIVKRFYGVIDAQRWDEQRTLVADDFTAHLGRSSQISFKAWQDKLRDFYKGFPDGHHLLEFHGVEGDRILTVGRFVGSHKGVFWGHPPTGIAIEMGVMHLDRVVDHKIVEHTASADLLDLLRQIGSGEAGAHPA